MKTIDIHGKPYVTVSERVKYFRKNYPGWSLSTEIIDATMDFAIMKCVALDENNNVMSSGHAFEMKSPKGINQTSYLENCETSAVGRCLGLLGIGIDGGIASLDEILSARQYEYISKLLDLASISDEDRKKIEKNLTSMTTGDAEQVIRFLQSHQLDPIESGASYSQKDINRRLDSKMNDPRA